jgi:HPr kinase/phosphorylase
MAEEYFYKLTDIIQEFELKSEFLPSTKNEIKIVTTEVNRPGLALTGNYPYFDQKRIQVIGKAEYTYLSELDKYIFLAAWR